MKSATDEAGGGAERARETGVVVPALVAGFATAVAMWLAGFVTHLPGMQAPPVATFVVLMLIQVAGGFWAARGVARRSAPMAALGAGLVASVINLLILGSVIASEDGANELRSGAIGIVLGSLGAGAVAALVGGFIATASGGGRHATDRTLQRWLGRFGVVGAAAALPVIFSGGLVTSKDAGLAVYDWPTSFGSNMFLFPLRKMTGGIYYEHAHRLFGSLIGLTMLALTALVLLKEPRRLVKATTVGVFLLVCAQGILGGIRVEAATPQIAAPGVTVEQADANSPEGGGLAPTSDNRQSKVFAMVHGIAGQLTFACVCAVAVILSPRWAASGAPARSDRFLRVATVCLLGFLVVQLVLGAGTRHFDLHPAFMHAHISLGALAVLVTGMVAGFRAAKRHADEPLLRRLGHATAHTVGLQAALGIAALVVVMIYRDEAVKPAIEVALTTMHQAVGAALLAFVTMLAMWTRKLVGT